MTHFNTIFVLKETETTRTNTTVLQADPELTTILASGITYEIDVTLYVEVESATPGIRYSCGIGGGAGFSFNETTMEESWSWDVPPGGAASVSVLQEEHWGFFTSADVPTLSPGGSMPNIIRSHGFVKPTNNVALQVSWCQSTSSADDTTVLPGSYIRATPVKIR